MKRTAALRRWHLHRAFVLAVPSTLHVTPLLSGVSSSSKLHSDVTCSERHFCLPVEPDLVSPLCPHNTLLSICQYFPCLTCFSSTGFQLFRVTGFASFQFQCRAQCWAQNELVNGALRESRRQWIDSDISISTC